MLESRLPSTIASSTNTLPTSLAGEKGEVQHGILRVASAPNERPRRISFAPDVIGGTTIVKAVPTKSISPAASFGSSSLQPSPEFLSALSDVDRKDGPVSTYVRDLAAEKMDLQSIITEQSQRICELEYKLKEAERKEAVAIKERAQSVKELEHYRKFSAADSKTVEQLKSQLHEEHTTNAGLIIFNRSLKAQVAELEGIIEQLQYQVAHPEVPTSTPTTPNPHAPTK